MAGSAVKQHVLHPLQRSVVNPLVKLAWGLGIGPPGDALLETTGRRTGQPRRTPICDGLEGETFWLVAQQTFWLVAQQGRRADKVRSGWRTRWRSGTAHILDDDDPRERQRILGRGNPARRGAVGGAATSPHPRIGRRPASSELTCRTTAG